MALKAGRVGVRPDQVDPYGRIKNGGGAKITDFEDSGEIIYSATGAGKIQTFLNQDVSNKIARSLLTPLSPPAEKKIVGIDTANAEILTGYSVADAGKVLSVSETGDLEWIEQQQGGGGIVEVAGFASAFIRNSSASVFEAKESPYTPYFDVAEHIGETAIIACRLLDNPGTSQTSSCNILGQCNDIPDDGIDIGSKIETISETMVYKFHRLGYMNRFLITHKYIYLSCYNINFYTADNYMYLILLG